MVNTKGIYTDDSNDEEFSRGENENFIVQEAVAKDSADNLSNHRGYPREDGFAETTGHNSSGQRNMMELYSN